MASPHRVLVAGGGPAAVESLLALRELAGERAQLELIAPQPELVVRAYEILAPFHEGRQHRYRLDSIAEDLGAALVRDALVAVDPAARAVELRSGAARSYDTLIVAVGARPSATVAGAIPFRGAEDAAKVRALLLESHSGRHGSVAFVVPTGHTWQLPIYELALHTSVWLADRGVGGVPLSVISPERAPLVAFGGRVSDEIAALLRSHGVSFRSAHVIRHEPGKLLLSGGQELDVGLAIAMTRLSGPAISGLPRDADGYIPVDANGGVVGVEDVYAAGDATTYPVKQGGLATQQADAIAALIATRLGADVESSPRGLLLRAVLFGGREKRYLRAQLGDQLEASSQASSSPLWPDSNKLIGRYLTPYLDSLDELSAVAGGARSEADP